MNEIKQLSKNELIALMNLFFSKFYEKYNEETLSYIQNSLNLDIHSPTVRIFSRYLIEYGVFVLVKTIKSINFYKVDREKIEELLDHQEILQQYNKYLKEVAILYGK